MKQKTSTEETETRRPGISTSLLNIMFGVTEIIHLCWLVSVVVGRNGQAQQ